MSHTDHDALAWVESPLQLVTAAEWAHRHRRETGRGTAVAYRISDPQVVATAETLHRMGAPFTRFEPYLGVPWNRLIQARHWVIGDPLSGQFRAATSALPRPHALTIVDDGAMIVHAMRAVRGDADFGRPGQAETRLARFLGVITAERIRALARRGRAELFTAFAAAADPARSIGATVTVDDFAWLRAAAARGDAPRTVLPLPRLALGSARVVDGGLPIERYLRWLRELAEEAPIGFLPHRRETPAIVDAVAALSGITLVRTGLPIELALAGAPGPLELHTLPSSTVTTLAIVLAGTGSTIQTAWLPAAGAARSVRIRPGER